MPYPPSCPPSPPLYCFPPAHTLSRYALARACLHRLTPRPPSAARVRYRALLLPRSIQPSLAAKARPWGIRWGCPCRRPLGCPYPCRATSTTPPLRRQENPPPTPPTTHTIHRTAFRDHPYPSVHCSGTGWILSCATALEISAPARTSHPALFAAWAIPARNPGHARSRAHSKLSAS